MISAIIPAHNAGRTLREAIDSILAQGTFPIEVLVVDDGSTDETASVAGSYGEPVKCWSKPRGGTASARNYGLDRARGELIAFLDADDLWSRNKIQLQMAALESDPTLEAVFGYVQQFKDGGDGTPQLGPVLVGQTAGAMLIRAEALHRVGRYDESLPLVESMEWFVRATNAGLRHRVLPDIVLHRRIHDDNVGVRDRSAQHRDYLRVLREVVQQKKAGREG